MGNISQRASAEKGRSRHLNNLDNTNAPLYHLWAYDRGRDGISTPTTLQPPLGSLPDNDILPPHQQFFSDNTIVRAIIRTGDETSRFLSYYNAGLQAKDQFPWLSIR